MPIKAPDSVAARVENTRFAVPRGVVIEKHDSRGNVRALLGEVPAQSPHASEGIRARAAGLGEEKAKRLNQIINRRVPVPARPTIDHPTATQNTRAIRPLGPSDDWLGESSGT